VNEGPFSGKTLVFTGTLTQCTREEAKERARAAGALVTDSISARTDFLIAGEGGGSKRKKATTLSIPVLSEKEWIALLSSSHKKD
jgi:DNA ligase (NAD+)